jgi:hypothetical protein
MHGPRICAPWISFRSKCWPYTLSKKSTKADTFYSIPAPGQLGPILVDFGLKNDLTEIFADGIRSLEITNEDIVAAKSMDMGWLRPLRRVARLPRAFPWVR